MNILWITNLVLPEISNYLGMNENPAGGWMNSSLKKLKSQSVINVAVATVYSGKTLVSQDINGIRYYLLPLNGRSMGEYNKSLETLWPKINKDFKPDIIHIHGTEFPHGLAWIRSCGTANCVISIQGLVSVISRFYNIEGTKIHPTIRSILKKDSIKDTQKKFAKRGEYEQEMLLSVSHVIGRTQWDKSHCWAINPNAKYHFCGETLRDIFYKKKWSYKECEPYRIFVSNGTSPIKGLHKLLESISIVLHHYPTTKIYVAGDNPTSAPWYRITDYGKYIRKLIVESNIQDKLIFTGPLNEIQMCEQYLKSNLFICCSSIENSPNSLGEAQLLSVPYLTSYVGGTPDIAGSESDTMYRYDETEMLAYKICEIFSKGKDIVSPVSDLTRYNADKNLGDLIKIYTEIYNQNGLKD